MAKDINEVHLAGRAGKDAETKFTTTGKQVSRFSLATGGGKKKDGSGDYPTEWHNCESWSTDAAEISKGDFVEVWGRLRTDSWVGHDGQKKYMTKIVVAKLEIEVKRDSGSFESGFESARSAPIAKGDYAVTDEHPITDDDIPFSSGR